MAAIERSRRAASITPLLGGTSRRQARAPTTVSWIARFPAISDCASPNKFVAAYRAQQHQRRGRARPDAFHSAEPRRALRPAQLIAGLTWDFSTGPHWQHRLFGFETTFTALPDPLSALLSFARSLSTNAVFRVRHKPSPQPIAISLQSPAISTTAPTSRANRLRRPPFRPPAPATNMKSKMPALADLDGLHARRNNQAGFLDGRWQPPAPRFQRRLPRRRQRQLSAPAACPAPAPPTPCAMAAIFGAPRGSASLRSGHQGTVLDQSFGSDPCYPAIRLASRREPHHPRRRRAAPGSRQGEYSLPTSSITIFADIVSFTSCFPGGPCPVTPPAGCPIRIWHVFQYRSRPRPRGHLERQLSPRAQEWLSLSGNYTYDDTRVIVSPNAFDPVELPGNRLLRRPVNSGNLVLDGAFSRFNGNLAGVFVGRRTDSDFFFRRSA